MSGKPQPIAVPDYTGLNLQTASMSVPVPLAWGQSRGSPNLIDYVGFQTHKKTVGKGGSVFGKQTEYTYSATIVLAVCEGPILGYGNMYVSGGVISATAGFAQYHFAAFNGTTPQSPWPYLVTNYPTHALSYQGVAYLGAANYNLGTSEAIPSLSFEVKAPLTGTGYTSSGVDADSALVIQDFLTNTQYGANFPSARLDTTALLSSGSATTTGDSAYQTYCRAMGFGIAPFYQNREAALDIIARICQITNTAPCWTGYSLKLIPWGDVTVVGNGVTYLPPTSITFTLADNDYVQEKDGDPLEMSIVDWFDAYNRVVLEMRDRNYEYNAVPIDDIDLSVRQLVGPRDAPSVQAHEICDVTMAKTVVQLILQRVLYIRKTFTFKVGPEHSLAEPMDVGTITEANLGLTNFPVRIRSIEEQDDGTFEWVVEEFPGTTGSHATLAVTGGSSPSVNPLVTAGPVNTPIIFEPNSQAAAFINNGSSAPIVVCAVSGGNNVTADPNWGGCNVWVSTDNSTYVEIGTINQPAPMGQLTGSLAGFSGPNPDGTDTLSVNLAESAGSLVSAASATTAAAGATLAIIQDNTAPASAAFGLAKRLLWARRAVYQRARRPGAKPAIRRQWRLVAPRRGGATVTYVAPSSTSYELVGPQTATLTGGNSYNLTGLYRGLFSSPGLPAPSHNPGALFARLSSAIFIYSLPAAYVGIPLYFKFQSFNIWNQGTQDLSACTPYLYTPVGTGFGGGSAGVPTTPTGLTATATGPAQIGLTWTANPTTDNVTSYTVFRASGTGASFGSATQIGTSSTASYTDTGLPASTGYTYFVKAVNAVGSSGPSAGANGTTSSTSFGGGTALPTAGATVTAGPGYLFDSSGAAKVVNADATVGDPTSGSYKPANCWISAGASSGASVLVYQPGQYISGLSLSPGATYRLQVGGGYATTIPSTAGNGDQIVGVADDTGAKLFFAPQPMIGV